MCIRDRHEHGIRRLPVTVDGKLVGMIVEHDIEKAMRRPGAVSYTHLRAHETVLDLVCRLLLEKKKIKSHIQITHTTHHTSTMPTIHSTFLAVHTRLLTAQPLL